MRRSVLRGLRVAIAFGAFFVSQSLCAQGSRPRSNPLTQSTTSERELGVAVIGECLSLSLQVAADNHSFSRLSCRAVNSCTVPVAILISPIEVRTRLARSDRFHEPSMASAVFAELYVYKADLSLDDSFTGEGGGFVRGEPSYVIVAPSSTAIIPFTGSSRVFERLPAGTYGLALRTYVAPARGFAKQDGVFNLGDSVALHNRRHAGDAQVERNRQTQGRLCWGATIEIPHRGQHP